VPGPEQRIDGPGFGALLAAHYREVRETIKRYPAIMTDL
jgi:hypothetical protein